MSYYETYQARLKRNGDNAQERLERGRQLNFQKFLHQSPHYVTFEYNDEIRECVFEPSSQDSTKTVMKLLCAVDDQYNSGDIINIKGEKFMFWFWEQRKNSGYNKWRMIKIDQEVSWTNTGDSITHSALMHIWGQRNDYLHNIVKTQTKYGAMYLENNRLIFAMMPTDPTMMIGSYIVLNISGIEKGYVVTGFDHISTPGIMYLSIDPSYIRDETPAPQKSEGDSDDDFFWLGEVGNEQ